MTLEQASEPYRPRPLDPVALWQPDGTDAAEGVVVRILADRVVVACAARHRTPWLREGASTRATFMRDDASFTGLCSIAPPISRDPREVVLTLPVAMTRKQRRAFLRVPVERPFRAWRDLTWIHGHTRNLSGGGALVSLPGTYRAGERLTVEIDVDTATTVRCIVRVVRTHPDSGDVALQFVAIPEHDRDHVIRTLWREQHRQAVIHRTEDDG